MILQPRSQLFRALALLACAACIPTWSQAGPLFPEFVDPNPAAGNRFGLTVVPLSTGNVVITSPNDDAGGTDAGAVYLFNGASGTLISTLRGSRANDRVGSGGVTALSNGHYVVLSPSWANGVVGGAGAVTWGSGTSGVSGVVSSSNSLVGSTTGDNVGNGGVTVLSNGNYVVRSYSWDNGAVADVGAATWGSGTSGVSGLVSSSNSLVGSTTGDFTIFTVVIALSNGNYVVNNKNWDNGAATDAGAVTWGSGTGGVSGVVSSSNSLVGSTANDNVGNIGVTTLSNGNYVVISQHWDNGAATDAGAVTWGSGTSGVSGVVSSSNSLVGSRANDKVGSNGVGSNGVTALINGNYIVRSQDWDNGAATDAGAVTWGNGTSGLSGVVSSSNSLVGSATFDRVGTYEVTQLSNGNYVVRSPEWDNGAATNAGAVTWGSGTSGVSGVVSSSNSLVGSTTHDSVGGSVTALSNGNYVVCSAGWDNGAATDAGAVTWCSGASGVNDVVSSSNSLVGNKNNDNVGNIGVTALSNGNYVVRSHFWDNGAARDAGAVTWGSGASGVSGVVTSSNSLVGGTAHDNVGGFIVTVLSNGNYVVISPTWDNGTIGNAGAVTWGSGTSGLSGVVSSSNSLVGSTTSDSVGNGSVTALSNGNYVVISTFWDNGAATDAGAVTWGSGSSGVSGVVSSSNSLVGSTANDNVGSNGVTALSNGNYVVSSRSWDNGDAFDAGAVTWGSGTTGLSGAISSSNSLVGSAADDYVGVGGAFSLSNGNYVVLSPNWANGVAINAGALTWGSGSSGVSGVVSSSNSLVGLTSSTNLKPLVADNMNNTFLGLFIDEGSGKVRLGSQADGLSPDLPTVTHVSPSRGSTAGGTSVTLTGTHFTGASAVTFGGIAATSFTVDNPFTITVATPACAAGAVSVEVTTPNGTNPANTLFTYIDPEIHLTGNGQTITSGDVTPTSADHTDFGSVVLVGSTQARTFSISNSGASALNLTGTPKVAIAGDQAAEFTVTLEPSTPVVAEGGSTVFTVTFDPAGLGTRTAVVSIANDDTDKSPYTFTMQGTAIAAEVALTGHGTVIMDGDTTPSTLDHTDFGRVALLNAKALQTFTIANVGTSVLNLTGAPKVAISGQAAGDFGLVTLPTSPVVVGESTSFAIAFDPKLPGLRQAVVTIESDDPDSSPFTFAISGYGGLATQQVQTIQFSLPASAYVGTSGTTIWASASSGLPVTLTVLSGPAALVGDDLVPSGLGLVKVQATQAGGGNYQPAPPVTRTITIKPDPTTLTLTGLNQIYNGGPCGIGTEGAAGPIDIQYKIAGVYGPNPPTAVGGYPVKAVAGGVTKTGTLVIAKAPLYVTPVNQRKFAGQPNPTLLPPVITGFQNGETAAVFTKAPVLKTTATTTSAGGLYPITASGGVAANYTFIYRQGTLVVESFAGNYEALLVDGTPPLPVGKLSLTVAATSKTFTGKLYTPTETAALSLLSIALTTNPVTELATGIVTVTKNNIPYVVDITLPLHGDVLATVTRDGLSLGSANNGRKLSTQTVTYGGAHTAVLEPALPTSSAVPVGAGWATASISTKGVLTLTGKLGDGVAFSSVLTPDVDSDPGYRLFVQPYLVARTESYLAGAFTLAPHPTLTHRRYVDSAAMSWKKTGFVADASYRTTFGPVSTVLMLDPWLPPVAAKGSTPAITLAQRLGLSAPNFAVTHSSTGNATHDGNLPTRVALSTANVVSVTTPSANLTKWKTLTFNTTTGTFTGSFELMDTMKRAVTFSGVLRQPATALDALIGDGHYLLPPLTGTEKTTGEVQFTRP